MRPNPNEHQLPHGVRFAPKDNRIDWFKVTAWVILDGGALLVLLAIWYGFKWLAGVR